MNVISGVYWNRGHRLNNEDSLALQQVLTCRGRVAMAVVCDGIGGLMEGEVASGFIVEQLIEYFYRQFAVLIGKGKGASIIRKCISRCFYEIGYEMRAYGKAKGIKLGTTVSMVLLWNHRYITAHLGDSRIYRLEGEKVKQITKDHSDGKHGLIKCMGSFAFQKPELHMGRIRKNQGLLLCTDGFYRRMKVSDDLWNPADIYEEQQITKRLEASAGQVQKLGEEDNLSAIYLKVTGRG